MLVFHFDPWSLLQLFVGAVLPLLVGLITTRMTAGIKKSILLLGLSVVTSALTELLSWYLGGHNTPFDVFQWLTMALLSFVVGVGLHMGLYKTPGADGTSIASRLADKGITADTPDYGPTFAEQFPTLHDATATLAPNVGLPQSYLHLEAPEGDLAAFVDAPGPKHKA
ncbi:holin [Arthrobacter phage TattModd]|nr:holin [Arthrobacter phage Glenn]YP_010050562.1 holin [Arthrobacter phage Wawa]ALY09236.1 holin [Arthrobacter phage Immaculata]AOT24116.1 holin [Arthrobacter phage Vallejo]AZF97403.1 holin [Arthrobacter phage Carpal]AZS07070.1 holin [Arthrobacter phage Cholula]AZS09718.1 holin [Arthrobacter phage Riverdale]AZS09779.1 holin [Arthrobacter phage Rozby]AZS10566.1 holin [Arthrobacter phage TattModd]AZS11849.1 holin [Arthrobacter phage Potatoes]QBZ73278.1 holin [Arthrobacter phage MrGloopy]